MSRLDYKIIDFFIDILPFGKVTFYSIPLGSYLAGIFYLILLGEIVIHFKGKKN